jgi:glycosyltransferase involved in cell wall biosynthesis
MQKVSVVTICRNSEATIEQALSSVFRQTYPEIEHIVIDGKSSDGTNGIIRRYSDRLAYWVSEPDRGIADAYNKGLAQVQGDVVGILNSDDYYVGDRIGEVMTLFAADAQLGFVFADLDYVDDQGRLLFTQLGDPDYMSSIFYTMPSLPHPTVFARTTVYRQVGGFDESYKVAMDYEWLLRVVKAGFRGAYLPGSMTAMRTGGNSDRRCYEGYRETRRAAVAQGYPALPAWVYCQYKCLKTMLRRGIEQGPLRWLVRCYRQDLLGRFRY